MHHTKQFSMNDFSNSIITPENLPEIDRQTFNLLEKKYRTILFIRIFIFFIVAVGGFLTFLFISDENIPNLVLYIFSGLILLITSYSVLITIFGFPKKGYLVRENDISFQRGIITFKSISIPFNRIQHVEVNQGVIAKIFKLSSIKIFTAGGTASDLSIPGLPVETAHTLKAFLSEKISEHE